MIKYLGKTETQKDETNIHETLGSLYYVKKGFQ